MRHLEITDSCHVSFVYPTFFLTAFLFTSSLWSIPNNNPFAAAAAHGVAGEIGNLFLTPPGFFGQLMNNDFAGETDKLLTGSTQLGLLRKYSESSLALSLQWRAVTPTFTYYHGAPLLEAPQGIFADWLDFTTSYSRLFCSSPLGTWRVQASGGFSHIGNKGMRDIQNAIHKAVGADRQYFDYLNQPRGVHYSGDLQVGFFTQGLIVAAQPVHVLLNTGHYSGPLMKELYASLNLVTGDLEQYGVGFELTLVRQLASDYYATLRSFRHEAAISVLLSEYFQPSIKFISPLLEDDQWGQTYLSPVNINIPF